MYLCLIILWMYASISCTLFHASFAFVHKFHRKILEVKWRSVSVSVLTWVTWTMALWKGQTESMQYKSETFLTKLLTNFHMLTVIPIWHMKTWTLRKRSIVKGTTRGVELLMGNSWTTSSNFQPHFQRSCHSLYVVQQVMVWYKPVCLQNRITLSNPWLFASVAQLLIDSCIPCNLAYLEDLWLTDEKVIFHGHS